MIESVLSSILSAAFLGAILRVTTPILLPSLGALISDRAGVINIGLEGIMLSSAFTGVIVTAYVRDVPLWLVLPLGFTAAVIVGVLLALLLAFFHLHLKGDLILGGVAINILGSAGTAALMYQIAGTRGNTSGLQSLTMPNVDLAFLKPIIGDALYTIFGNQNVMTWIAFIAVAVVWFMMYRMPVGKHLRAVGENPEAAASVGINVRRMRYLALALSGLLAGLGGIYMSMGYLSLFQRDMTAGRGFIALATPALGNGTPVGTMLASILFGGFYALSIRLGSLQIPPQLPEIIPYASTVIALVIYSWQRGRATNRRARQFQKQMETG
jgi:simple sugar transport system permease protein